MYKSPIELLTTDIYTQIMKQQEEDIYQAVVKTGVNVDKEELIRALQYDRNQYEAGYRDGKKAAARWIPVSERLPEDELDRVLVATDCDAPIGNQKIDTDRYRSGMWVRYGDHVTHWMPLPEPPKGR